MGVGERRGASKEPAGKVVWENTSLSLALRRAYRCATIGHDKQQELGPITCQVQKR